MANVRSGPQKSPALPDGSQCPALLPDLMATCRPGRSCDGSQRGYAGIEAHGDRSQSFSPGLKQPIAEPAPHSLALTGLGSIL